MEKNDRAFNPAAFTQMAGELKKNKKAQINITGLSPVHQAFFIAEYYKETGRQILALCESERLLTRLVADINTLLGAGKCRGFGERDYSFRDVFGASAEYEWGRIAAISGQESGRAPITIASVGGALQYTINKESLERNSIYFEEGKTYNLADITKTLARAGYERRERVTGFAEFSVRGGILDIFSPGEAQPTRIEFWGNEVDSIHTFAPEDQRRGERIKSAKILPAREIIVDEPLELAKKIKTLIKKAGTKIKEEASENAARDLDLLESGEAPPAPDKYIPLLEKATIFDYFDEETTLFYLEAGDMEEAAQAQAKLHEEDIEQLFMDGVLFRGLEDFYKDFSFLLSQAGQRGAVFMDVFARGHSDIRLDKLIAAEVRTLSAWGGEYGVLKEHLEDLFADNYAVILYAGTEKTSQNLAKEISGMGFTALREKDALPLKRAVLIKSGSLSSGIDFPREGLAIITHSKVQTASKKKGKKKKPGEMIRSASDISVGDYIVHSSHGIGIFEGIQNIETDGIKKDYIKIRYAGSDNLYVPVTQLDLVSKYLGRGEGSGLKLNRLNSGAWEKTRTRVRAAAKNMAKELTAVYAARMAKKGFAFSADTPWQAEFEERFDYEETDDQLRSVIEIKGDMERGVPMDRLLCGDVGFGKTEVALRAIFKAVMDGKQCALLAPTTILAQQHFETLTKRFEGYPMVIGHLSRFVKPREQAKTIKALAKGEVDIVIGTHRIVQKDIVFKDLGLVVVDEEQRFGVKDKERFKKEWTGVDMLTLSATPIPRTLNIAMAGIWDMSVLEEPPQDRQPISTYVLEHSEGMIIEAIKKEIRRGGQVYYLYNRTADIDRVAARIAKSLPEASVGFAHGRMGEAELSDVWGRLNSGELDVLVCTTIIETGVDVPNCNTLVVEDADRLGLAQLYQIRGRVGRSARRAYAYFTFKTGKVMTEIARKRLTAIKEFTNFGSGFQIALRDLEIRGAGSILGGEQHGHMEAVGYDLYMRILSQAIAEEKGLAPEQADETSECLVDAQIEAHIPQEYIESAGARIEIYKKIALIRNKEDSFEIIDELIDRFGEPPPPVLGLCELALIRSRAIAFGITEIKEQAAGAIFYMAAGLRFEEIAEFIRLIPGRALFNAGSRPYLLIKKKKGQSILELMDEVLSLSEKTMETKQEI